eukprot:140002_1
MSNDMEKRVQDVGMPQIFCTIEFWLLYLPFIIICGVGLVFIENVGQIIESASSTATSHVTNETMATSLVSIISVGNFIGRIVVGYLSDYYRYKFDRVFWMMWSCIGMCVCTLSIYFMGTSMAVFCVVALCIGISYGWIFVVTIATCTEFWGTRYLSGNYAALDSAAVFGQLLFSNLVFATLYEKEARHKPIGGDNTKCYGDSCYKYTFLICSASCVIALIMSACLWIIVLNKRKRIEPKEDMTTDSD